MTTYGGFATFETYLVAGWLNEHAAARRHWKSAVREARRAASEDEEVRQGLLDPVESLFWEIERQIREKLWSDVGPTASNIAIALLDAAARRVDWSQLARFVVDGMRLVGESAPVN